MEDYSEKLNNFKERVNAAENKFSMQEVRKVEMKLVQEVQLNVWIPKAMLQALKQKSLDAEKSIKQMVQEALVKYLQP